MSIEKEATKDDYYLLLMNCVLVFLVPFFLGLSWQKGMKEWERKNREEKEKPSRLMRKGMEKQVLNRHLMRELIPEQKQANQDPMTGGWWIRGSKIFLPFDHGINRVLEGLMQKKNKNYSFQEWAEMKRIKRDTISSWMQTSLSFLTNSLLFASIP